MRKLNENAGGKEVKYLGEGLVGVYQNGRLVERYQLEKGDDLLEAFGGRRLTESDEGWGPMDDDEAIEYVNETVDIQKESAVDIGDRWTRSMQKEAIIDALEVLQMDDYITSEQYDRLKKYFKV